MKILQFSFALCLILLPSPVTRREPIETKLWAALSVSQPLFQEGWTNDLMIHFTLVNDGSEPVNAEELINASKIIVNGEEWEDSGFIFGNGPRPADPVLRPGRYRLFTIARGGRFQRPGIYQVVWRGESFESSPITFRIMPSGSSI